MEGQQVSDSVFDDTSTQAGQSSIKDNTTPAPILKEIKICGICHLQPSKYKCAKCKKPYCSVDCATLHKDDHPPEPGPKTQPVVAKVTVPIPTSTAPGTFGGAQVPNPFTVLDTSSELQALFKKYPKIKSQLRDLHAFTLPPSEGTMATNQYAIQNHQSAANYRPRGGRGGVNSAKYQRPQNTGPWNVDQGVQNAIDALSRAKDEPGKDGEGIREYVRLIAKLVSSVGDDVVKVVQDEVAAENARLIQELLDRESY